MTSESDVTFREDEENHRYVAEVDGELAALTVYHLRKGPRYFFVHTEVKLGHGGKNLGSSLVRYALDDVREHDDRPARLLDAGKSLQEGAPPQQRRIHPIALG